MLTAHCSVENESEALDGFGPRSYRHSMPQETMWSLA